METGLAEPKPSRAAAECKQTQDDADRPAMPAGHPVAWQVLTESTLLAGVPYPLPVFL